MQNVLAKAAGLDIAAIAPLHGPVLTENLSHYLDLYKTWSSYTPQTDGILIAYTSVYGNTEKAVACLVENLKNKGCEKIVVRDLARCDMAEAVADAFRFGKTVLATTTYNADVFPIMRTFIEHLTERGFKNRTVGLIENGTWAPMAVKVMRGLLESSKNITYTETAPKILSALDESSKAQIAALADELCR